eukprot:TRINITY_DN26989_c0_g2_i1.p1 TRINITY_DN26989_c0_g2~~TRINITY_DN26989_c0_g2_i1.p1  ORF type:complete len:423 (-),score=52.91 TRINITY_DN26989_c0_g2_i1:2-1270(-)
MAPSNSPDLTYRDYTAADDEPCKALEMRAMQGTRFPALQKVMGLVVRAGFEHLVTFDAKARQYEDCIIRVVEDRANKGRVVGVCCAALKTARMHSEMCKVAYIFDLRVDEDYQGHGIGKKLSIQIEEACQARGAKFLYLTVNSDNTKAKSLYAKRGFVHASYRSPSMSLLASLEQEDQSIAIERVSPKKAIEMTAEAHRSADLTLHHLSALFESPLYEGTFLARQGNSFACVSAWNGSFLTGFKIERLFLPITWWRTGLAKGTSLLFATYALLRWMFAVYGSCERAFDSRSMIDSAFAVFMTGITASSLYFLWRAWPTLSFIAGKVLSGNTKLRHRLFAPFASGPVDEQEKLMRALLKHLHNEARASGYGIQICNLDKHHPLRSFFPSSKFTTQFLYKQVGATVPQDCPGLSSDNFFDPRDL